MIARPPAVAVELEVAAIICRVGGTARAVALAHVQWLQLFFSQEGAAILRAANLSRALVGIEQA